MRKIDTYPPNSVGHVCFICHNSRRRFRDGTHEELIDTKRFINRMGEVVICQTCILESAAMFGALSVEASNALRTTVDELQSDLALSEMRVKELETLNDAFNLISSNQKKAEAE